MHFGIVQQVPLSNISSKKQTKGKQVDILRIPSFIPHKSSKSILEKSKFFKRIELFVEYQIIYESIYE